MEISHEEVGEHLRLSVSLQDYEGGGRFLGAIFPNGDFGVFLDETNGDIEGSSLKLPNTTEADKADLQIIAAEIIKQYAELFPDKDIEVVREAVKVNP